MPDPNQTTGYWREKALALRAAANAIEELDRHDTPVWQANDRLNSRAEICYQALERIAAKAPPEFAQIARDALEAAGNVQ